MGAQRIRGAHGAAAVEFALVVVPLIALIFGIIQYGLYFWAYQGGSDIARSAARLAAVGQPADCATFRSDVKDQIGSMGDEATATVTRTYTQADPSKVDIGDTVSVTVAFKSVDLHFPFVPFIHDGLVSTTAHARVDYVPAPPETCS